MAVHTGEVRTGPSVMKTILVVGAIGLLAAPVIKALARRGTALRRELDDTDARVDKSLKDTFPASDPPAQHFTDIPVNRQ